MRYSGVADRRATWLASLLPLALAGCLGLEPAASGPLVSSPPPPIDPVAAFAARATPGVEGQIVPDGGSPTRARVQRAYIAASGRECREVVLGYGSATGTASPGFGPDERATLVCNDPELGWRIARPLLRGAHRP